jgi:hypothetical protein
MFGRDDRLRTVCTKGGEAAEYQGHPGRRLAGPGSASSPPGRAGHHDERSQHGFGGSSLLLTGHRCKLPSRGISDHDDRMGDVHPFPNRGSVFVDARGEQRTMRVACHQNEGLVVISLWAAGVCRASFRLPAALASEMAEVLAACGGGADPGPRVSDLTDRSSPAQAS